MARSVGAESLVLLVNDQPDDVVQTKLALDTAGFGHRLVVLNSAEQALKYMRGDGYYADRHSFPLPGLLLLDLELLIESLAVLGWLHARPGFDRIASVVLSKTNVEADVLMAKRLGADDFLLKPDNHRDLVHLMLRLHARFFSKEPRQVLKCEGP